MRGVYLIHFNQPISDRHTCQHYIGYSKDIDARIEMHRKGTSGARLFEVAKARGITFRVAQIWKNKPLKFERELKNKKNARKFCPICQTGETR